MWQPDPKFKYLYEPVQKGNKTYWYRKDKLKDKKFLAEIVEYENRELPESVETKSKQDRANMARFLRTGKF